MVRKSTDRALIELSAMYEISKILSFSLDLASTFRGVLNLLAVNLDIRRGMIVMKDGAHDLHLVSAVGMRADEMQRGRYRIGEGLIGNIMRTGIAMIVPDVADEPMYLNRTGGLDQPGDSAIGFVGVPVKAGGQTIGVLAADRVMDRHNISLQEDQRFLTMVANLIGQTVRLHHTVSAEREALLAAKRKLETELQGRFNLDNVVGTSKAMQEVFAEVIQAAPTKSTVLLRGESGTGKEVIARAIHVRSPRKDGPFIKVNCAALTETLLESELFGHEKGSFTGAVGERKGRFELAHGGTLFLDEIGDISPAFQAKLLRVLQEREFERVGGTKPIKVDVRLICATNRDLEAMVKKNEFRGDLYYRINVVSIFLPPLRERRADIPSLVSHFLERYNKDNERDLHVSPEAMSVLMSCYWPGNVRELENCVERVATMTTGNQIRDISFPCQQDRCLTQLLHQPQPKERSMGKPLSIPVHEVATIDAPAEEAECAPEMPKALSGAVPAVQHRPATERERLVWAMEQSGWVQAKAARLLNITPRQMGYALQKYKIEIRKF